MQVKECPSLNHHSGWEHVSESDKSGFVSLLCQSCGPGGRSTSSRSGSHNSDVFPWSCLHFSGLRSLSVIIPNWKTVVSEKMPWHTVGAW